MQTSTVPVNYRSAGQWKRIDNTIRPLANGEFGTSGNSWTVAFGPTSQGMTITSGRSLLSLVPVSALDAEPRISTSPKTATGTAALNDSNLVPQPSAVSYQGAWPDTDMVATVRTDSVAEDLILASAQSPSSFAFAVSGAEISLTQNGSVAFSGTLGHSFGVAPPRVIDATGQDVTSASGAQYSIDGGQLTISLDPSWLASQPLGAFPITVDPTLTYQQPNAVQSFSSTGGTNAGNPITVGSGSPAWAAGVEFNFSAYAAYFNTNYRVYDAQLQFSGMNYYGSSAGAPLQLWNQYPSSWSSASYTTIGQDASLVEGPWQGPSVEVGADMNAWVAAGNTSPWFGVTSTAPVGTYSPSIALLTMTILQAPQASRITNLANGSILTTTSPTLQAAPIPDNAENPNEYPVFDYQITTGTAPGTGLIIDSGRLCENNTGNPNSACPSLNSPPSWSVPPGLLSQGVTYHAWVLTDWFGNNTNASETAPPVSQGVSFTINLGFGAGGPSPTDSVGSVPGQVSTPSLGAPSPGLPGSQVTVNMVDGNLSFQVATPQLDTVGGGLALGFSYNSLAATTQGLDEGLQGYYYDDNNGDESTSDNLTNGGDTQIGRRVDSTVNFDWGRAAPIAAQDAQEAAIRWTGNITLPYASTWALGDISSDGMNVSYNGTQVLADWGPHAPQVYPTFGTPFSGGGSAVPITVDWHHSSSAPAVAQLVAEDLTSRTLFPVDASWLSHDPTVLPAGWTLDSNAAQANWAGLADHGTSVTLYGTDGSAYEFAATGNGTYQPPVQVPNARLVVDSSGNFVLDDPDGGLIYTFDPSGSLTSVGSASDDLHPAALTYQYTGSPPLLTTITDPVSGRATTLTYGPSSSCPTPPSGFSSPPADMLCQVSFWDGTATDLYYLNGELGEVVDPGNVVYQFGYESTGSNRLTIERDPLSYDAIASGVRSDCPPSNAIDAACATTITYDSAGRVATVTPPAPNTGGTVSNGGQPERAYCYNYDQASITLSNDTVSCTTQGSDVTAVAAAGFSPSVGYAEQVRYDARKRITSTRDSSGLATTYSWDSSDRLVSTIAPSGVETSTAYDTEGHPIASYGPAPSSSFQPNGQPIAGKGVPNTTTTYDGNMSGLGAAWYANTGLLGTPSYHSLSGLAENWSGGTSPSSSSSEPNLIPSSGFSGDLTGLVNLPQPGQVSFNGDGGAVYVDGSLLVNEHGGPYAGAVSSDRPMDFWRLADATGTTATDSAGSSPAAYEGSVSLGQPSGLGDGASASAAFNGTNAYVALPNNLLDGTNLVYTVEARFKTTSDGPIFGGQDQPVGSSNPLTAYDPLLYVGTDGKLHGGMWQATNLSSTQTVNNGVWHTAALTEDPFGNVNLYLDGTAVASGTNAQPQTLPYNQIGAGWASGWVAAPGNVWWYFNGDIADVAVYRGPLSGTRLSAHQAAVPEASASTTSPVVYNTAYPKAVDNDEPVSYWRLADSSGTSATDSFGSNAGTYNSVSLGQPGSLVADSATSSGFNGSSSYVNLPGSLLVGTGFVFTIEARFKTNSDGPIFAGQDQPVGGSGVANYDPALYVGTDGLLHGGIYAVKTLSSTEPVNDQIWHDAALTEDTEGNVSLYLDGRLVGEAPGATYQKVPFNQIGAGVASGWPAAPNGWWYFNGDISDVSLYNQALGQAQVAAHYAASLTPYPKAISNDAPVDYWRLDQVATSLAVYDSVGQNAGFFSGGVTLGQPSGLNGDPATATGFDGSSGFVALPENVIDSTSQGNGTGDVLSVEARFKTTSDGPIIGGQDQPMGSTNSVVSYDPLLYVGTDGKLHGGMWQATGLSSSAIVNDGNWHDAVLTVDSQGNVTLYLDGQAVSSGTGAAAQNIPYDQIAGGVASGWPDAPLGWWYFNGSISDVALYSTVLDASQVSAHYAAAATAPAGSNTVHRIEVIDQQFAPNGHLDVTTSVSGSSFDPDYGLVTSTTDADQKTTTTSYSDPPHGIGPQFGLPTSVTQDPSGLDLTTQTTYETPGPGTYLRVLSKTLPAGSGPQYGYYGNTDPPLDDPVTGSPACGLSTATNEAGALESETDPAPATGAGDTIVKQYVYDNTGRQVGARVATVSTIASAPWQCTTYDQAGRVTSQSYPAFGTAAARTVSYSYGVGGNPLVNSVTDTNWPGAAISSTVDLLDRLVSYTDIFANTTTTSYDQLGRVTSTSGPQGTIGQNYSTSSGQLTTVTDGSLTLATAGYDSANGRLVKVSYANGTDVAPSYDSGGRPNGSTVTDAGVQAGEIDTLSAAGRVTSANFDQGDAYSPVTPTRVANAVSVSAGGTANVTVGGANGDNVPLGAAAADVVVTAANSSTGGSLSLYPAGAAAPSGSVLSFGSASATQTAQAEVALGDSGQIVVANSASAAVTVSVDVLGYFTALPTRASQLTTVAQTAIADTRSSTKPALQDAGETLSPGTTDVVQVTGNAGVPSSGVSAVVVQLEAVGDATSGQLVAYSDGSVEPQVATLAYTGGASVTKEATVALSSAGKLDVTDAGGTTDMVVSVVGYYSSSGSAFFPTALTRIADSRSGSGYQLAGSTLTSSLLSAATDTFTARNENGDGVPSNATSVVLSVLEVNASAASHFVLYPAGGTKPSVEDVTFPSGGVIANEVTTPVSSAGQVSVTLPANSGSADVVVDVEGYFAPAGSTGTASYSYDGAGRLTQATMPASSYSYGYGTTTGCTQNSAGLDTNRTSLTATGFGPASSSYCYDNADRLVSTSAIPSGQVVYDTHGNTTAEGGEQFVYDSSDQLVADDTLPSGGVVGYARDPLGRVAQINNYGQISAGQATTKSTTTSLTTTITLTVPSGTAVGDLLLAAVTSASGNDNITAPAGWTAIPGTANSGHTTAGFWHIDASGDPTSVKFDVHATLVSVVGALVDLKNPSGTPLDVSAAQADASSTSQPLPTPTTTDYSEQIIHVVGYNAKVTASAPHNDQTLATLASNSDTLLVSDAGTQQLSGPTAAASASSLTAAASEALTIALKPATTVDRLGYTGQTDTAGFTENSSGTVIGVNIGLPGGTSYATMPSGAVWSYTNLHGDVIVTADENGNPIWTGYWGPYGEDASGSAPTDTAIPSAVYGYNGGQGKLTEGSLTLMGVRPYQSSLGRFTQPDPVQGGCANDYTYGFGDPINHPDLSGKGWFSWLEKAACYTAEGASIALGVAAAAASAPEDAALFAAGSVVLSIDASLLSKNKSSAAGEAGNVGADLLVGGTAYLIRRGLASEEAKGIVESASGVVGLANTFADIYQVVANNPCK